MKTSRYHKFLRTSMVIVALLLIFDSGILFPITKQFSNITTQYVASVGSSVNANVPSNEYNVFTAEIAEQRRLLDAREATLIEREIEARSFGAATGGDSSTFILSIILFVLTSLIIFNYIMDFARMRRLQYESMA